MDISKIKEICAKLPKVEPLPLKYGEPKYQFIRELAKQHNIPLVEKKDFGNIEPVVNDENEGSLMNFTQKQISIISNALLCYKDESYETVDEMEDLEKLINKFADLEALPEQVHKIMENLNKISTVKEH